MDAYRAGVHRVPVGAGVHTARQLANNLINVTLDSLFIKTFQKTWGCMRATCCFLFTTKNNIFSPILNSNLTNLASFSSTLTPSSVVVARQHKQSEIEKNNLVPVRSFDFQMQNFRPTLNDWTDRQLEVYKTNSKFVSRS